MISKRPHKEKVEFLKTNGFCFACLTKAHMSRTCKKRATCSICRMRHPTILHSEENVTKMCVDLART